MQSNWTAVLPSADPIDAALARLREDGFVAYPTETVWGLGACADRPEAIDRLMAWKGRASETPLAVLTPSAASVADLGCRLEGRALVLAEHFWPGPLMLVLPCDRSWAKGVAGAGGALGVRCSPHPIAMALAEGLHAAGLGPLTSTSFNRSGDPPATCEQEARALLVTASGLKADRPQGTDLGEPLFVSAKNVDAGAELPSTVVDCTGDRLTILRVGAIAAEAIEGIG